MATIPRILALDASDEIGGIIRGAMTLMDRRHILVEVPSADAALDELQNSTVDLFVAAYTLPSTNGLELAARAIRESAGTPVIILASSDDPHVDEKTLADVPYTYLVRPVGEQFIRALRVSLDGEAAVVAQETPMAGPDQSMELGPVPDVDEEILREHLTTMMRDTVAIGAFVADRMGRVAFSEGIYGYFDLNACAALLGPHFAQSVQLRDLIGGNAWALQYYDGENYDIFAMALGLHYFAVLIFEGDKRAAFGPVTRYGREGAEAIIEKLGPDAWKYRKQVSVSTQNMSAIKVDEAVAEPAAETPEAVIEEPALDEEATKLHDPVELSSLSPEFKLDPIDDLDVDSLFSQDIDESEFDNMFSDDDLSSGQNVFVSGDNSVSFDEAMDLGFLDE